MSERMTREDAQRAMERMGLGAEAIERALNREYPVAGATALKSVAAKRPGFPICITLPWSALCSDNDREKASMGRNADAVFPRKVLSARYKAAAEKIRAEARRVMDGAAPLDEPLKLEARVFTPTQRRADVVNFAKGVHDALSKIVYTDDKWLRDVRWVDVGLDVDRPRAELTITPL